MNKAYERAIEGIKTACPSGTSHPNDFARVVHVFKILTESGKFVDHPDNLGEYLEENGFTKSQAEKIQRIYEVFESAAKDNAGWSDKFISEVLSA